MIYLFGDLGSGDNSQESPGYLFEKSIKDGVVSLTTAGTTGTFKLQVSFYNGSNFMKYHDLQDEDGTVTFDVGDSVEFGFFNQPYFKQSYRGAKIKYIRSTGSGVITITNAYMNVVQND